MSTNKAQSELYAEDLPYWNTDATLASNQDRIERLLDKFSAEGYLITQLKRGDQVGWMIRFEYKGRVYRLEYRPWPTSSDKPVRGRPRIEAAMRQMASRAYWEIKSLLTAAAFEAYLEVPRCLIGYMELPGESNSGTPPRVCDLPLSELPVHLGLPALPMPETDEVST